MDLFRDFVQNISEDIIFSLSNTIRNAQVETCG